MESVRVANNSIDIEPNSIFHELDVFSDNKSNSYDCMNVGSGCIFTGSFTFSNISVRKIIINDGCCIDGFGVFSKGLYEEIEIRPRTNIDGPYSFQYCSYLNRVQIDKNVEIAGLHSFFCCSMAELILGTGIRLVGTGIFFSCKNIKYLEIPDDAYIEGSIIFAQCVNLKIIRFRNNITIRGNYIFSLCESLEVVYFGDNVSIYGEENFNGCLNITTIEHGDNFLNEDETLRIFQKLYNRVQLEEIPEGVVECSICLQLFDKKSVVVQTICGHYFNKSCLCAWLVQKKTCPICRALLL